MGHYFGASDNEFWHADTMHWTKQKPHLCFSSKKKKDASKTIKNSTAQFSLLWKFIQTYAGLRINVSISEIQILYL